MSSVLLALVIVSMALVVCLGLCVFSHAKTLHVDPEQEALALRLDLKERAYATRVEMVRAVHESIRAGASPRI